MTTKEEVKRILEKPRDELDEIFTVTLTVKDLRDICPLPHTEE